MSTAEYERLGEVRDELERVNDSLTFITDMVGIAMATALFYLTLRAGWWKGILDV